MWHEVWPECIESFLYEWETYGTELRSRYGIEDIFNQSQRANSSLNQSECLDTVTVRSPHSTNRTVTTSHSFENDSTKKTVRKCADLFFPCYSIFGSNAVGGFGK